MKVIFLFSLFFLAVSAGLRAETDDGAKKVKAGLELMAKGDFEGALARFRDAQIEHPTAPEIHFNVGIALYHLERYEEARQSLANAYFSRNKDLEMKSHFHAGNCYVKEGKFEEALDAYNKAVELDENYHSAKVNREWVIRKLKELARKKKEQDEKKKQERRIIEKLQEIIQKELGLHASTRATMRVKGTSLEPTKLVEFAQLLDAEAPPELAALVDEQGDEKILDRLATAQDDALADLRKLLTEVRTKIQDAEAAQASGATPGAGGGSPQNPETAKLVKALPFMENAEPAMARASVAARDELDYLAAHLGQETALKELLKALNELLDELSRIIKDQAASLRDLYTYAQLAKDPNETLRPSVTDQRDSALELKGREEKLRQRTSAFARAVEMQLEATKKQNDQQQGSGGPGVQPGQDPKESLKKMELALGHLHEAAAKMEEAEAELVVPKFEPATELEKKALEELLKARAALLPPRQNQGQNKEQQEGSEDQQDKQQGEKQENKDQKQDQNQENKPQDQQDGDKEQKQAEPREMSEEQAQKTLQRYKQRERDRRKARQDKMKKARRVKGSGVKKDW